MPSTPFANRSFVTVLVSLLVVLGLFGPAGPAAAAAASRSGPSGTDWDGIAACESGGRWHINTGNGYHGGLQISPSTWRAYGGHRYASRADLASRAEQIAVGERIARARGLSPWANCARHGVTRAGKARTSGGGTAHRRSWARSPAPRGSAQQQPRAASGASGYLVRPGDCLSAIAWRMGVPGGTKALYDLNRGSLRQGPDHIYPGQRLRLRA